MQFKFKCNLYGLFFALSYISFHFQCKEIQKFLYIYLVFFYLAGFIYSNSFGVETKGFSLEHIVSSTNSEFCLLLLIWIPFIYFSCCIALARTSNSMLNRSDESEHTHLLPSRKAFLFSLLNIMLAVG